MTTEQLMQTEDRALGPLGMVFVDGYQTEVAARFDYYAFEGLLAPQGVVSLHDTDSCSVSRIYGPDRLYFRNVKLFADELKQDRRLQAFDLPFDQGVTLVRKLASGTESYQ